MSVTADQITIAITVYNRREYLPQAIHSALNQTIPVRVMVLEDCGPDPTLQDFVRKEFGSRIEYVRNPRRRGLFGNWNACIDSCKTPWLSILHDDDYLAPQFVESMMELHCKAPSCALLFGQTSVVDPDGVPIPSLQRTPLTQPWKVVTLRDALYMTPFPFPGQIFRVDQARVVGGFREFSKYTGDWEMWARLIDICGSAETASLVAFNRQHTGWDRGTNIVVRSGWQYPASYVQHKRVLALLRRRGESAPFDRGAVIGRYALPTRFLLRFGAKLSPRLLAYHRRLLLMSRSQHLPYAVFQLAAWLFGTQFLRGASFAWKQFDKGVPRDASNVPASLSQPR